MPLFLRFKAKSCSYERRAIAPVSQSKLALECQREQTRFFALRPSGYTNVPD